MPLSNTSNLANIYLGRHELSDSRATELLGKKQMPVYNFWSRNLSVAEETLPTQVSPLGIPSTYATYDSIRLSAAAGEWERMEEPVFGNIGSLCPPSTIFRPTDIPLFPDNIDNDAIDFCVNNNLLGVVQEYYRCLLRSFKQVSAVEVTLSADYEIPDALRVRFRVNLESSDIDQVLADEDQFNRCALELIEKDSLSMLVATVQLI